MDSLTLQNLFNEYDIVNPIYYICNFVYKYL